MPDCINCFIGCDKTLYDRCMKYTGDGVDALSICNGEYYNDVIASIIDKLLSYQDGSGIAPDVDVSCTFFSSIIGAQDVTLQNILQSLITGECSLKTQIDSLSGIVNGTYSFNTSCLTLGANPSKDDILQAAITKICSIDARVTAIENDYVKASELDVLIQQYLDSISTSVTQQYTKMVPYVAYEYYGPLTNFDSGGKGISVAGFDKVYLCNGSNGTPDKRGRVAVGVNVGIPGGAMDSAVDPAVSGNYQITLKGKLGEFKHVSTIAETASHSHTVNETEHFHYTFAHLGNTGGGLTSSTSYNNSEAGRDGNSSYFIESSAYVANTGKTSSNKTNITINAAGGNQAHNNVQPSIGANYIMYIP